MHRVATILFCLSAAWGQPASLLVVNAAKQVSVQPETHVAPGSLVDLSIRPVPLFEPRWFDVSVSVSLQSNGAEPISLAPVQVLSPSVVRARVPEQAVPGLATLILRIADVEVARSTVRIVPADPGIFTAAGDGFGPAAAQLASFGKVQANGLTRPARPGDYVVLWATGLGQARANDVKAWLGEEAMEVRYAGPAPGLAGVDQINVQIPERSSAPDGCYVPLRISIGEATANPVTLTKTADGSPCTHPLGLTTAQMNELDEGRTIPVGSIGIYSLVGPPPGAGAARFDGVTRMDHADANFLQLRAAGVATITRSRMNSPSPHCSAEEGLTGALWLSSGGGPVSVGERIRVSRGSQSVDLMPANPELVSSYIFAAPIPNPSPSPDRLPPSIWTPGRWTIDAPGSDIAGPLHASLDVEPAIAVTNSATVKSIDRSKDLSIEWSGQGYGAGSRATVVLSGTRTDLANPFFAKASPYTVICSVEASAGRVVIPESLLRQFDRIETTPEKAAVLSISVQKPAQLFSLPSKTGDAVPTMLNQGSGELLGVSIR